MDTEKGKSKLLEGMNRGRRRLLGGLLASGAALAGLSQTRAVHAEEKEKEEDFDLRFPGDEPEHKIVYQFNKADEDYHQHVLFSVGAMLRKYGDNIKIVVTAFGPGIHILAQIPQRPVSETTRQRVDSLHQYGVEFHACGNTMKSLGWTDDDLLPFVKSVEVGASDIMELQEQGYAYISW